MFGLVHQTEVLSLPVSENWNPRRVLNPSDEPGSTAEEQNPMAHCSGVPRGKSMRAPSNTSPCSMTERAQANHSIKSLSKSDTGLNFP
eukprot:3520607-Pleurochrysis_carterae.AAC.2